MFDLTLAAVGEGWVVHVGSGPPPQHTHRSIHRTLPLCCVCLSIVLFLSLCLSIYALFSIKGKGLIHIQHTHTHTICFNDLGLFPRLCIHFFSLLDWLSAFILMTQPNRQPQSASQQSDAPEHPLMSGGSHEHLHQQLSLFTVLLIKLSMYTRTCAHAHTQTRTHAYEQSGMDEVIPPHEAAALQLCPWDSFLKLVEENRERGVGGGEGRQKRY